MWSCEDYIIAHCKRIYGMQILYKNRKVYVKTSDNVYQIDFTFANNNVFRFIDDKNSLVLTETCLPRALFKLASRTVYKEIDKEPTQEDWERFVNDAYRYEIYLEDR
jgi:hypothetical protein